MLMNPGSTGLIRSSWPECCNGPARVQLHWPRPAQAAVRRRGGGSAARRGRRRPAGRGRLVAERRLLALRRLRSGRLHPDCRRPSRPARTRGLPRHRPETILMAVRTCFCAPIAGRHGRAGERACRQVKLLRQGDDQGTHAAIALGRQARLCRCARGTCAHRSGLRGRCCRSSWFDSRASRPAHAPQAEVAHHPQLTDGGRRGKQADCEAGVGEHVAGGRPRQAQKVPWVDLGWGCRCRLRSGARLCVSAGTFSARIG
jgi:hypothetical protein